MVVHPGSILVEVAEGRSRRGLGIGECQFWSTDGVWDWPACVQPPSKHASAGYRTIRY